MLHDNLLAKTEPSPEEVSRALEVLKATGDLGAKIVLHCRKSAEDPRLAFAELIRFVRRNRGEIIGADFFGEASWDILLALYVAHRSQYRMTITAVCNESCVPQTTALRWLQHLVETGLVERRANPYDKRATYVELTPAAVAKMDKILENHVPNRNT